MRYNIEAQERLHIPNIEAALKVIDPVAEIVAIGMPADFTLNITLTGQFTVKLVIPQLGTAGIWEYEDREISDPRYDATDRTQRLKERIRFGIIKMLGGALGKIPSWGILSGVRPTKIFHYLRDKGFTAGEIRERLQSVYGLTPDKADLLTEVGIGQESFFRPPHYVSVYVGIPFCPTRCHYCSFAAVSLETHRHLVKGFLAALQWEIEQTARLCEDRGFMIDTIYIGGGTPTSLSGTDFAMLLEWIRQSFDFSYLREFTVEAGRPETLSAVKLEAMVRYGVSRVSVNPQTMRQETLKTIGRLHSIDQINDAVALVKTSPLALNMDLILGLPAESGTDFAQSLQQVVALDPDNITIHTLAPKRASNWRKKFNQLDLALDRDLQQVNGQTREQLLQAGYHPYYLYRQRAILADLENIGYCKPGKESIYNIQMMEERQTIFGLGGGAVTKWVINPNHSVHRHQNPKCPATYGQRVKLDLDEKASQTQRLLG